MSVRGELERRRLALLFGPAALWAVVATAALSLTALDEGSWRELDRRGTAAAGSADCVRCHPAAHESWHGTYHRTMTQEAEGEAVLAPFAGEQLAYGGFVATMTTTPWGRPHLRVVPEVGGEPLLDVDVEMTVGSHHYQQYVARLDGGGGEEERWRLPVAWHLGEQRWIHMNGAFVEPEAPEGDPEGYLRHLSRWNDNCVFCHNTEPVPGLDGAGFFDTEVAELGIACEACHGPASLHVRRHASPWRRLLASGEGDGSITHPGRLDADREAGLCGRCHGQRIGHDIDRILRSGDGFVPGRDLSEVSRPIYRDSEIAGLPPGVFAARFWPDGTPRLSAYEYQGLLLSPCHDPESPDRERMRCGSCHTMHGGDPDDQLLPGHRGPAACASCHAIETLSGANTVGGHGGHGEHAEVSCQDCHQPRITYGLLLAMRSHRITTPDPGALVGRHDQPDACTQCHVDRTRRWASDGMARLGLAGSTPGAPFVEEQWGSRVLLDLHGGDPIQRNLAADALARPGATGDPATRMAWLVDALEDEYPSVRWFARRGIRTLAGELGRTDVQAVLGRFDPLAPVDVRVEVVAQLRGLLGPGPFSDEDPRLATLRERRDAQAIWIGE